MNQLGQLSLQEKFLILSETIRLTEKSFIHWDDALFRPTDLGKIAEIFFEKARIAESRFDFELVMLEYFSQLRNAHSGYYDKKTRMSVHFPVVELDGKWIINQNVAGVLQPGDVVVSIAGKRPSDWCKQLALYTSIANSSFQKIRTWQMLFRFIQGSIIELEIEDRNSSRRNVFLSKSAISTIPSFETEGRWIKEGKIAYVRIPSFQEPRFEEKALEFVNTYSKAMAIIIDLRGNSGGATPETLITRLMNYPYRWWLERSRHPELFCERYPGDPIYFAEDYRYAEWRPKWVQQTENDTHYTGQLILLVDRITGSAAEDFVMPFKDNHRAIVVGERTSGSTGQPIFRRFGDNITVAIGSIRSYMPTGEPFEGIGLTPDIEVTYTHEDIYLNRDIILNIAIEYIVL